MIVWKRVTSVCAVRRLLSLAALLLTASILAVTPVAAQCDGLSGCVLVWSDEFDGSAVDLTKWTFQLGDGSEVGLPGGWGNNELQWYRAENATVSGGFLTITAKEESFAGRNYTSARMRSLAKGDWTFGRFEMRARMPIGQGLWPAFWLLPSDPSFYGTWAASGEIDVMEMVGQEPEKIFGTIHYGGPFPANVYSSSEYILSGGTSHDDFHVYAVEWENGEIRWYIDGVLYGVRTSWYSTSGPFPAPFDVDFHLLLNMAVGGNLPGPPDGSTVFPQELVVDYVRVYQVPNDKPSIVITSPTPGDFNPPGEDLTITVDAVDDGSMQYVEFLQDQAVLGRSTVPPFDFTIPGAMEGCYTITARGRDDTGLLGISEPVDITVGTTCAQAPYRIAPAAVPGVLEAEDYDLGGQGLAYNDIDPGNNGGGYRPGEGVDLENCSDTGYGFNLGWTSPGEWIEYTVTALPGSYDLDVRVASEANGGTFHLELDGVDRTGPISFGSTFGWQNWTTVTASDVTFDGGVQTLRLVVDSGSFNVNSISSSFGGTVGSVSEGGGLPLTLAAGTGSDLVLSWDASCLGSDGDFVVYEGQLGDFESHEPVTCSTAGATSWPLTPAADDRYYLVVASDGAAEGSRGLQSSGAQRAFGASSCLPLDIAECP